MTMKYSVSAIARWLSPALTVILLLGTQAPVAAQEQEGVNANPAVKEGEVETTPAAEAVRTAAMAQELAVKGIEDNAPELLIAAARLIATAPLREGPDKEPPEGQAGDENKPGEAVQLEVGWLLDRARSMVPEGDPMRAVIDRVASIRPRGRVNGPGRTVDVVSARGTDRYRIRFRGREPARIWVRGDGDTDLDCYVYDQNGNLIDSDLRFSDRCELNWRPRWTGSFVLRIRNLGRVWNRYVVLTN